jgi:proteasome lid subunit RPN8/RPN11
VTVQTDERLRRRVLVPRAVLADLDAHARAERPNECCGLLVGEPGRVRWHVRARNVRASPTRYQIDPRDHFAAIRAAREAGLAVVGAYHSHPTTPAVPSITDLAEAYDRSLVYVIVSLASDELGSDVRGFVVTEDGFEPVELVPVD